MTISPVCRRCGNELEQFGALLFGPPTVFGAPDKDVVVKDHLCVPCYEAILDDFDETGMDDVPIERSAAKPIGSEHDRIGD